MSKQQSLIGYCGHGVVGGCKRDFTHDEIWEENRALRAQNRDLLAALEKICIHLGPLSDYEFPGYSAFIPGSILAALAEARAAIAKGETE